MGMRITPTTRVVNQSMRVIFGVLLTFTNYDIHRTDIYIFIKDENNPIR